MKDRSKIHEKIEQLVNNDEEEVDEDDMEKLQEQNEK